MSKSWFVAFILLCQLFVQQMAGAEPLTLCIPLPGIVEFPQSGDAPPAENTVEEPDAVLLEPTPTVGSEFTDGIQEPLALETPQPEPPGFNTAVPTPTLPGVDELVNPSPLPSPDGEPDEPADPGDADDGVLTPFPSPSPTSTPTFPPFDEPVDIDDPTGAAGSTGATGPLDSPEATPTPNDGHSKFPIDVLTPGGPETPVSPEIPPYESFEEAEAALGSCDVEVDASEAADLLTSAENAERGSALDESLTNAMEYVLSQNSKSLNLSIIDGSLFLETGVPAELQALSEGQRNALIRYLAVYHLSVSELRDHLRAHPEASSGTLRVLLDYHRRHFFGLRLLCLPELVQQNALQLLNERLTPPDPNDVGDRIERERILEDLGFGSSLLGSQPTRYPTEAHRYLIQAISLLNSPNPAVRLPLLSILQHPRPDGFFLSSGTTSYLVPTLRSRLMNVASVGSEMERGDAILALPPISDDATDTLVLASLGNSRLSAMIRVPCLRYIETVGGRGSMEILLRDFGDRYLSVVRRVACEPRNTVRSESRKLLFRAATFTALRPELYAEARGLMQLVLNGAGCPDSTAAMSALDRSSISGVAPQGLEIYLEVLFTTRIEAALWETAYMLAVSSVMEQQESDFDTVLTAEEIFDRLTLAVESHFGPLPVAGIPESLSTALGYLWGEVSATDDETTGRAELLGRIGALYTAPPGEEYPDADDEFEEEEG